MIDFDRSQGITNREPTAVKIVGIGGAGSNALDRIVLDGIDSARIVALNTDVQALTSSVASEKVQLGRGTTRGLGAGGDPEVGYSAAEEAADEIRGALEGASMIFLCVGLGGGTGSGAAPMVAHLAKERGALVVVIATMPFEFEGRRRMQQATEALASLEQQADIVVCYENDRMGGEVDPKAGIHEAFAAADHTISQSVRAFCEIINRPGLINIGFDDLSAALRNVNSRSLFGHGEAKGENRAHDALAMALKNPLMDKGKMLLEAHNVLVNVVGGQSMTLDEVQVLMHELGRHISDETRVLFGTGVDDRLGEKMTVTILSSVGLGETSAPAPRPKQTYEYAPPAPEDAYENPEPRAPVGRETAPVAREEVETPVAATAPEGAVSAVEPASLVEESQAPAPEQAAKSARAKKKAQEKQETLQFEPVARGRFEKSEPTIIDGQDLDVPTFLRRNVRVK